VGNNNYTRTLVTRFFAYVQLKKIERIATGELLRPLKLTSEQEKLFLSRLAKSGWIVRLRRGLYLIPPRIPEGPWNPGIYLTLQKLMEDCNGKYQICGLSAFSFYQFTEQIPNTTYVYNNRISGRRKIGSLNYVFIKVSEIRLGDNYQFTAPNGAEAVYSSKLKTLIDAVYNWSRFNSIPEAYYWIQKEINENPDMAAQLIDRCDTYGNAATKQRIGYLLDILGVEQILLRKLIQSSVENGAISYIPWIPNKSRKGKTNRKWGVIVNGQI